MAEQIVVMYDAIHANVASIPANPAKVALYVSGTPTIDATPADWAAFPHAGHVAIWQNYGPVPSPRNYDVLDVERGAFTPQQVAVQIKTRIEMGIEWTTIYGTDATLQAVYQALEAAPYGHGWFYGHVDCWLADWSVNQTQAAAIVGTLVRGMTCRAVQYNSLTSYDVSVAAAAWHPAPVLLPPPPVPVPVPVPGMTRAQALAAIGALTEYVTTHLPEQQGRDPCK